MIRAAWLGHWDPPWPLGRGRRWGDLAWALAALGQAWILGGREGRWPVVTWEARLPRGPRPGGAVTGWETRPPLPWIALLRHGRLEADPRAPGPKEGPHLHWAWSRLLEGEAEPLLAFGTVHLDLPTRLRWCALLGAEDPEGRLRLPPYLEGLVPSDWAVLPPGWWSRLLGGMDAQGRLLPEGRPPGELPLLDPAELHPLGWRADTPPPTERRHLLPDGRWMLDPAVRAWGRGLGASPEGLTGGRPLRELASPNAFQEFLRGEVPRSLDEPWQKAIAADLAGRMPDPIPPPCGLPWLDHLRVRWGAALTQPPPPGYPLEEQTAHPCGDPFAWMALGTTAYLGGDPETARAQFGWAHAHFKRLGAGLWEVRAAHNAAVCALLAGDLEAHRRWSALAGPPPEDRLPVEALRALIFLGRWSEARERLLEASRQDPGERVVWELRGLLAFMEADAQAMREALTHLKASLLFPLLKEALDPIPGFIPVPSVHAELRLLQSLLAFRQGHGHAEALFAELRRCPNRLLHLAAGREVLRGHPEARTPERLLELEALASRAGAEEALEELAGLWPAPPALGVTPGLDPEGLGALLEARGEGLWLVHGEGVPQTVGHGPRPPEGLIRLLHREGPRAPVPVDGRVWVSHPLFWEGTRVGIALLGLDPGTPLAVPSWLPLLAPWVASLGARSSPEPKPQEGGLLLTDGSEPMASLLRELARVAPSRLPVLLLGPSGSGKELVAQEVHARSGRPGPWVPVNCAALAEGVLESELFGHVKGAYTGAHRDRAGALERAHRGTLFLDEVADLSPRLQSLLLRALQEGELQRVGSDRTLRVDLRVVAATHKDLEALVARQAFRTDLWYRLQGCVLRMPSLHERCHELPALLPDLAAQVARESGLPPPRIAPGLGRALAQHPWPGNFRELRHALQRAMLRAGELPLGPAHFPELRAPATPEITWESATRAFQKRLLLDQLRSHGFHASDTARALGLTRPALYATARRLGVDLRGLRPGVHPITA